jgi:hypothetical protein
LSDGIQFTKKDNPNNKITIPYGIDLTNYNKTTFRQSLIDQTSINNPHGDLYDKIINSQKFSSPIKTRVSDDILPRVANTMLIVYYTSYIHTVLPQVTDSTYKPLIQYFCTNETYPVIKISVINSTATTPKLYIEIFDSSGAAYKQYIIRQYVPKVIIDLTADLAASRSGQEIVSAQFMVDDYGEDLETYYKDCVNILNNVFISYTYKD